MATGIVLGYTSVFEINGHCATDASWNLNPQTERFYCLDGKFTPVEDLTIHKANITLDVTVYSPGPSVDISPSKDCDTQDDVCDINVSSNLVGCGAAADVDIPDRMMVTSYSYSKEDGVMPGEESWSLQRFVGDNVPSHVIRGISEGTATEDAGIEFRTEEFTSSTGNVSAESVGRANTVTGGTIERVGGGSSAAGVVGEGSADIPYTPLWLGSI